MNQDNMHSKMRSHNDNSESIVITKLRDTGRNILASSLNCDISKAIMMENEVLHNCIEFCNNRNFTSCVTNPRFQKLYSANLRKYINILRRHSHLIDRADGNILQMSREKIFPDLWQKITENHQQRMIRAYETRRVAKTKQYICPKCKQNECDFYEMQCRSADECMSLFISCLTCGHQWRIG